MIETSARYNIILPSIGDPPNYMDNKVVYPEHKHKLRRPKTNLDINTTYYSRPSTKFGYIRKI